MKHYIIILALLTFACTNLKKENADPGSAVELAREPLTEDQRSYVGFLYSFPETKEFYVSLNYVDDFNYDLYNNVVALGDSVVHDDHLISKRTRIAFDKGSKYFDLSGLKEIKVYDTQSNFLTTGKLVRIEYYENNIESDFVGVFKLENPNIKGDIYCIGNTKDTASTYEYAQVKNLALTDTITRLIKQNREVIWNITHYLTNDSIAYSIASADTTAFIFDTSFENIDTLYESKWNELIGSIIFLPKKVNRRPILLADCGAPQTDANWTLLLVFDGQAYKPVRGQRIKW